MCTDEQFKVKFLSSLNWGEVQSSLCEEDFRSYEAVKRRAKKLGLSHSHFKRWIKFTDEKLKEVVAESKSMSEVVEKLGLQRHGAIYAHYSRRIKDAGISTDHFMRNKPGERGKPKSDKELLVLGKEGGSRVGSKRLRAVLIRQGMAYECAQCKATTWNGVPLPLHIDHKNEKRWDNRIENLWFLCPNCHVLKTRLTRPGQSLKKQGVGWKVEEILTLGAPGGNRQFARKLAWALKESGVKQRCGECKITKHCGKPVALEIDHKNGKNWDNRLENLWLLCPNCHMIKSNAERAAAATPHFCSICGERLSNKKKYCKECAKNRNKEIAIQNKSQVDETWVTLQEDYDRIKSGEVSYEKLGEELGITGNAVKNRLRRRGLELPQKRKPTPTDIKWPTPESIILRLHNGESYNSVANSIGVDSASVRKYLKRKGFVVPAKREEHPEPSLVFEMWKKAGRGERDSVAQSVGLKNVRSLRGFLIRNGYSREELHLSSGE